MVHNDGTIYGSYPEQLLKNKHFLHMIIVYCSMLGTIFLSCCKINKVHNKSSHADANKVYFKSITIMLLILIKPQNTMKSLQLHTTIKQNVNRLKYKYN